MLTVSPTTDSSSCTGETPKSTHKNKDAGSVCNIPELLNPQYETVHLYLSVRGHKMQL